MTTQHTHNLRFAKDRLQMTTTIPSDCTRFLTEKELQNLNAAKTICLQLSHLDVVVGLKDKELAKYREAEETQMQLTSTAIERQTAAILSHLTEQESIQYREAQQTCRQLESRDQEMQLTTDEYLQYEESEEQSAFLMQVARQRYNKMEMRQ